MKRIVGGLLALALLAAAAGDASAALLDGIEASMALADRVDDSSWGARALRSGRGMVDSWLPAARARRLARLGIAAFFVIGLLQLGLLVGVAFTTEGLRLALTVNVGDHPVGQIGQVVLVLSWILNAVVTILTGICWWALRPSRLRRGLALRCGYSAMLLLLVLGNLLSSYVDQFAVLAEAALQVLALALLARWDHTTRASTSPPATASYAQTR